MVGPGHDNAGPRRKDRMAIAHQRCRPGTDHRTDDGKRVRTHEEVLMKALRYENETLSVANVAKPEVQGEAVVRVTLSGICNTDLEITRGYAGFQGTIGHEFVGVIEDLPKAGALARPSGRAPDNEPLLTRGLVPGDRVVGEINAGCGNCELCRA